MMKVTACDGYGLRLRGKRGERGEWKRGAWGRREREGRWWVYERERASRIEGLQSPLGSLSADSLGSHLFYVPGQGQIIHSPLRPLNCLRPHRSFCHLPPSRRLFIGLPAIPPPSVVAHHRLLCYRAVSLRKRCRADVPVPSYIVVFRIFCSFLYS